MARLYQCSECKGLFIAPKVTGRLPTRCPDCKSGVRKQQQSAYEKRRSEKQQRQRNEQVIAQAEGNPAAHELTLSVQDAIDLRHGGYCFGPARSTPIKAKTILRMVCADGEPSSKSGRT